MKSLRLRGMRQQEFLSVPIVNGNALPKACGNLTAMVLRELVPPNINTQTDQEMNIRLKLQVVRVHTLPDVLN